MEGARSGYTQKITKSKDGWLAGGAGSASDVAKFLRWVEDGRVEDEGVKLENLDGLLISPKGIVFLVEADLNPFEIRTDEGFYAAGTGYRSAMAAMEMGATAQEAVEVTIKWDTGCGGKVQKVEL